MMRATGNTDEHSKDLAGLLRHVVAMDAALRSGAALPAPSPAQTHHLVLLVTEALLAERRERLPAVQARRRA